MRFYIGTYTRFGGPGIAVCELSGQTLRLLITDALPDATYVVLNRAGTLLYAVSSCDVDGAPGGSVASYDISGGGLVRVSHQNTGGAGACFPCLSADERFLYTANYGGGSVSAFPLTGDAIGPCMQLLKHEGQGPNAKRQLAPHTHQVTFIPGENRLCAVDIGIDKVIVYAQDPSTGMLREHDALSVPGGYGPRHMCYGENGLAYLAHELASQVSVLKRENDAFSILQTLPALPEPNPDNTASAIRLRGKRLYVSNRGDNSIAVYDVLANGLLSFAALMKTHDDFPRDFCFIDDSTLLIAHQKGGVTLSQICDNKLKTLDSLDIKGAVCVCMESRANSRDIKH